MVDLKQKNKPQKGKTLAEKPVLTVTESEVADYLQANPAFFSQHPELLGEMSLPHETGPAVSLIERQLSILRDKNRNTETKLLKLVQRARDNEGLSDSLQKFAVDLLSCNSLQACLATIQDTFVHEFNLDQVAIRLLCKHPENIVTLSSEQLFNEASSEQLFAEFFAQRRLVCGRPKEAQAEFLFAEAAAQVRSIALIPLQKGEVFGVLAFGSSDSQRFQASLGMHFLNQIGDLCSARLNSWL